MADAKETLYTLWAYFALALFGGPLALGLWWGYEKVSDLRAPPQHVGRFQVVAQVTARSPTREEGTVLVDTQTGRTWMICDLMKWCPMSMDSAPDLRTPKQ